MVGLAEQLGCDLDDTELGPVIRAMKSTRMSVRGIARRADAAQMMKSLAGAVAGGYAAGAAAHQSLLLPMH